MVVMIVHNQNSNDGFNDNAECERDEDEDGDYDDNPSLWQSINEETFQCQAWWSFSVWRVWTMNRHPRYKTQSSWLVLSPFLKFW